MLGFNSIHRIKARYCINLQTNERLSFWEAFFVSKTWCELHDGLATKKYQETAARPKQIKIKKLTENPKKARAIIAVCMQRDPNESLPEWEEVAATAMAVRNMWLAATEMGIGSYWSSPELIKDMGEFFDLNEGEKCLGFFFLGYFDEELSEGTRQPIADKVEWIK